MKLWVWAIGAVAVVFMGAYFYTAWKTDERLEKTIQRWTVNYHLSPEQAERIRAIERKFHGSGFSLSAARPTAEELRAHQVEIAGAMNPEDGERFLKAKDARRKHP